MQRPLATRGNLITDLLRRTRDEWDLAALARAGYYIIRQGRLGELLHGIYSVATTRPSPVQPRDTAAIDVGLTALERHLANSTAIVSRQDLVDAFGDRYAVAGLPDDFAGCRVPAVATVGGRLVLGEYGEYVARLAVVSRDECHVFAPYERTRGVRHIHLVWPAAGTDEIFVTAGDAAKLLDRFVLEDGVPRLAARHRTRLGGHTAAADVCGRTFFGTDFSGRPNWIETLDGEKYVFPGAAYRKWVVSLTALDERYLVAVSDDVGVDDGLQLSVFDAHDRSFVLCLRWTELFRLPYPRKFQPPWHAGRSS